MKKITMSETWFNDCSACLRVLRILVFMIPDSSYRKLFLDLIDSFFDSLNSRVHLISSFDSRNDKV